MANPERANVNQRLYFASLHLQCMRDLLAQQQVPGAVVERALGESVVNHLIVAYRAYLRELAAAYLLPDANADSAQQLSQLLANAGKQSAECAELLALEQSDTWLSDLQRAYAGLGTAVSAGTGAARGSAGGAISLQQREHSVYELQTLEQMHRQLHAVIENQRTRLEEW